MTTRKDTTTPDMVCITKSDMEVYTKLKNNKTAIIALICNDYYEASDLLDDLPIEMILDIFNKVTK